MNEKGYNWTKYPITKQSLMFLSEEFIWAIVHLF